MKAVTLKRVSTGEGGTFGVLMDGERPFALTCERPWLENRPNVSCIPPGKYECRRVRSPRFGETFEVANVPERSEILFHKGNTPEDTRGCILLGTSFGEAGGKASILSSGEAFKKFMKRMKDREKFTISIEEA